jgi:ribose/xylose/arabinose/galactoside ABC-type transport system permease subunit
MGAIIPTVLAVGMVAGAFNGILVTKLGLPSLAVTIGTLTLYRDLQEPRLTEHFRLRSASAARFPISTARSAGSGRVDITRLVASSLRTSAR